MSNVTVDAAAAIESRQALIRVWMAISGVWVVFWVVIAGVVVTMTDVHTPLVHDTGLFSLIVLAPPLALLVLGALARLAHTALGRHFPK